MDRFINSVVLVLIGLLFVALGAMWAYVPITIPLFGKILGYTIIGVAAVLMGSMLWDLMFNKNV